VSKQRHSREELNLAELPSLPAGWCWTTLATIAAIEGGITKDQKRERTTTMRDVPYLRVANVQRGYLDLDEIKTILADADEIESLRLRQGDILFTEGGDRDKLGRGWVWNNEIDVCIHQNHIFRARPNLSVDDPKFVSLHGNFFGQQWFSRTGKQTTNLASINKGILSRFPIPLAPTNEQRRIVAKIEELFSDLDAAVAALKRAKANVKNYRAAILKAAVEGKLTAGWRSKNPTEPASKLLERILAERRRKWEADQLAKFAAAGKEPPKNWKAKYVEPKAPDTSGLPALPAEWCWASVEQLNAADRPISYGVLQPGPDLADGVPLVRVCDVADGKVLTFQLKRIAPEISNQFRRTILRGGEVLLTVVGTIGRTAVAPLELAGANTARAVAVIAVVPPCSAVFLELTLRNPSMRSRLTLAAHEVARKTLNLEDVRVVAVPLAPADEQCQVIAEVSEKLSQAEVAEAAIDHSLFRADRLRQSILKQAFEGKLVSQDPKDKPVDRSFLESNGSVSSRSGRRYNDVSILGK